MTTIKELKARFAELNKIAETEGKKAMEDEFRVFFDENPGITAIAWTQYAPAFNDGDACIFSVHEPFYSTMPSDRLDEVFSNWRGFEDEEDEEGNVVFVSPPGSWSSQPKSDNDVAVTLFMKSITDNHIFSVIFGEDSKVMVTRGGIKTDYVEHD